MGCKRTSSKSRASRQLAIERKSLAAISTNKQETGAMEDIEHSRDISISTGNRDRETETVVRAQATDVMMDEDG